jgi:hypothetical protein
MTGGGVIVKTHHGSIVEPHLAGCVTHGGGLVCPRKFPPQGLKKPPLMSQM